MKKELLLFTKELRALFFSKAAVLFLIILSLLTGYSFYSAVSLYSNASVSAIGNPLYAAGFEPVPGLFVPLFGGLFLLFSLFLPFVVIPLIVSEKEQNTLTFLLQIPFSITEILMAKVAAATLFLLTSFVVMMPATLIWWMYGGHIPLGELALLHAGYLLYGLFVIAVSLFSASLFSNSATASLLSIFLITFSWVIDFGRDMNISPLLLTLSEWTTTRMLHLFESAVFSSSALFYFLTISLVFFLLTRIFFAIKPSLSWVISLAVSLVFGVFITLFFDYSFDMSESHKHSFPPHITAALQQLPPVDVSVYLRRSDSRFKDYEATVIERVHLVKSDLNITMMHGEILDEKYGLFIYKVGDKTVETYSNSEDEIFPLLFELAGIAGGVGVEEEPFPGYPLVVNQDKLIWISLIYYLLIPLLFFAIFIIRKRETKRRLSL
ncbi:ABC transporter permease [bacterium]|nr:ABC transporter permease [bacterium]